MSTIEIIQPCDEPHNVTNVNTEGYARQRLDMVPVLPHVLAGFEMGGALTGETLRQIRDEFTDKQFRSQNSLLSQYETEEAILSQLEGILSLAALEPGLNLALEAGLYFPAGDRLIFTSTGLSLETTHSHKVKRTRPPCIYPLACGPSSWVSNG